MSSSELSRGLQILEVDAVLGELVAAASAIRVLLALRVERVDELRAVARELERVVGERCGKPSSGC